MGSSAYQKWQPASRLQLVIVIDGLRPDYVTPELMPRVYRLGQRGIVFAAHHSVFPTVTRVNGSSMVTGAYPEAHGLLGNSIYIPAVSPTRVLDTGARENLQAVERAAGRLLTAPTLGEILERAGKRMLVVSTGTSGSAYVLDNAASNRTIFHPEYTLPEELAGRLLQRFGPAPPKATPNTAQHRRAVDAFLSVGIDLVQADVTLMWLSDPDSTAHTTGIGSAPMRDALRGVDGEIGRVEDALQAKGLLARTNIIVTSDHGFSTHIGGFTLNAFVQPFARKMPDGSSDIVVAEGAIYFRGVDNVARVAAVARALQQRPETGAIFTRPRPGGGVEGVVPGTLSFDVVRWNHARAGDMLVSANWSDDRNEAGFRGTTTQDGAAGHGASSPFDVHATLIAAGPDFREHAVSNAPTGNVDLAPTVLHLLGLGVPPTMTGRVVDEGLRTAAPSSPPDVTQLTETVRNPDGSYELTAHVSIVAGHRYLDFTDVKRRAVEGRPQGRPLQ